VIDFHALDLLVRGGTIALLALWSAILFRDHRETLAGRLAVAMNVAIACHVLASIPGPIAGSDVADWIVELGSVSVPALFLLFARAWFDDETRIGWLGWATVPFSMVMVAVVIVTYPAQSPLHYGVSTLWRIAMFGFALAGLYIAWRGRDDDLIEERRALRTRLVGAVGAFVLLTNIVEIAVFSGFGPERWRSLLQAGILLLTLALCAAMFGIRQPALLGAVRRSVGQTRPEPAEDDPLAARLTAFMESEKAHRDEGLTIAGLAARLGEQEYRLRRVINGQLGHRNFAQFLNGYRLAEVKAALADPSQKDVPILTIALDAGFGSLGPFNRAFREAEGITPTEYRARAASA
jgi:AraC-like DNA-binding protein